MRQKEARSKSAEFFDWLEVIAVAVVTVVSLFTFVCRIVMVDGESMVPTLQDRQRVVVTELFYTPKVGDVVIACVPGKSDPYVKRVIASEGQTVDFDFEAHQLVVDGVAITEEYINETMTRTDWYSENRFPLTVPEGQVFICGDNRNNSNDSRYDNVGPIDEENIMGKVVFVLTPFNQAGLVE